MSGAGVYRDCPVDPTAELNAGKTLPTLLAYAGRQRLWIHRRFSYQITPRPSRSLQVRTSMAGGPGAVENDLSSRWRFVNLQDSSEQKPTCILTSQQLTTSKYPSASAKTASSGAATIPTFWHCPWLAVEIRFRTNVNPNNPALLPTDCDIKTSIAIDICHTDSIRSLRSLSQLYSGASWLPLRTPKAGRRLRKEPTIRGNGKRWCGE